MESSKRKLPGDMPGSFRLRRQKVPSPGRGRNEGFSLLTRGGASWILSGVTTMRTFLVQQSKRLSRHGLRAALLLILLGMTACEDTVTVNNNQNGEETGILADGQTSTGFGNDVTRKGPANLFGVNFRSGAPGEIVAFTNRRPVAISQNVPWTDGRDAIAMSFQNQIQVPVTCWILQGPFAASRTAAINMCVTTSGIWNSERMGVNFSDFEIVNATADPDAATYLDFTCAQRAGIQNDIGRRNGRINIYVVRTVDGGAGRGQACQIGSDFVAICANAGTELLSHELGHDFALQHVDGQATFDQTNIMHSASSTRQFITEGQLFRAHLRTDSALNSVYNARAGQPTRNCNHAQADNGCPFLNKRIWDDGTFPAN